MNNSIVSIPSYLRRNSGMSAPRFSSIFDDLLSDTLGVASKTSGIDIYKKDNAYHLRRLSPGIPKENVDVRVEKNTLVVEAKSHDIYEGEDLEFVQRGIYDTSFSHTFNLPDNTNIDEISANMENGVLHVVVPLNGDSAEEVRKINVD